MISREEVASLIEKKESREKEPDDFDEVIKKFAPLIVNNMITCTIKNNYFVSLDLFSLICHRNIPSEYRHKNPRKKIEILRLELQKYGFEQVSGGFQTTKELLLKGLK